MTLQFNDAIKLHGDTTLDSVRDVEAVVTSHAAGHFDPAQRHFAVVIEGDSLLEVERTMQEMEEELQQLGFDHEFDRERVRVDASRSDGYGLTLERELHVRAYYGVDPSRCGDPNCAQCDVRDLLGEIDRLRHVLDRADG